MLYRLSYDPCSYCWRLWVSIPLPLACKASALPYELNPQSGNIGSSFIKTPKNILPPAHSRGLGGTLVPYMTAVGFEPTSANTVDLKSTPLDLSGTLSLYYNYVAFLFSIFFFLYYIYEL